MLTNRCYIFRTMTITKCDACTKEIGRDNIQIGLGFSPRFELCEVCARPIVEVLKKLNLLEEQPTAKKYISLKKA